MSHLLKTITFTVILAVAGCRSQYVIHENFSVPIAQTVPEPVRLPADASASLYSGLSYRDMVIQFYENRDFKLAWFDSLGNGASSDSMIYIIEKVRYSGLLPQRYHLPEIEQLRYHNGLYAIPRTDVLLTDAFLRLSSELEAGVSGSHQPDSSKADLLRMALRKKELVKMLKSVEPDHSQYKALKRALRSIVDSADFETRSRFLSGELDEFWPVDKVIERIEVNLERWRAEERLTEEGKYIIVNVPSFMLAVVKDGRTVMESRVIVGTAETPTPDITSQIECIVIYPFWHVPRRIAVEEYLPVIKRDTSFTTRNNFDVLDKKGRLLLSDTIDWKKFNKNYFPVSLRQREGKENSLGLVKFVFDNPYAVFVHDTNAKWLFKNEKRTYSHGCIRMEKAFDLAHYLLTNDISNKSKVLVEYLAREERRTISLSQPMPIYVRYFTCSVINDKLVVYNDCYGKDKKLLDALENF